MNLSQHSSPHRNLSHRIAPHTAVAAGLALALAPLPAQAGPRRVHRAGTVITSTDVPVSVRATGISPAGRIGGRMISAALSGGRLTTPLSAASLAQASGQSPLRVSTQRSAALIAPSLVARPLATPSNAARPRLVQNVPDGPAAAPREEPRGLEVPVGPEPEGAQPVPAAPPAGEATPATPAAETPAVTPGLVTPDAPIATPDAAPVDAEGRPIAIVRLVGNRVVPESSVLLQATTQRGAAYSSRQIELDRAKIDALGFFASVQAQVTPNLEDPTKVDVTFIVVENRVLTGYQIEGNTALTDDEIIKVITAKIGNVLNRNNVNADIEAIQALYRERGFAGLVSETRQLENGILAIVIQEGTISKINFSGLKKTSESLLRRQIRTVINSPFDQSKLRLDLNRLYDTGFFEDVSYRVSDDADKPGAVIITILLKEKRTGQLSLGVGFDNRSKVTGFASVADTNFRGGGLRVNAGIELGSRRTFELGIGNPFLGKNNASFDAIVFNRITFREPRAVAIIAGQPANTSTSYEERRTGGRLSFVRPFDFDRINNVLLGFRAEKASLFQTDPNGLLIPVNLPTSSSGRVVAPSIGFLHDNRDLRLDASSGGREQFTLEKGLGFLGGNASFTKLDVDLRRYFPLMKAPKAGELPKLVFAGRVVLGRSIGQLPAFEQYFIGGTDTVRGYDVDEQFGDNQIYSNLELRYRFQRKFTIVGFVDAGSASGGSFASTGNRTLFSVGAGVRVQTPIGPLRLDIGRGRDGVRTHFGIGPTF